MMSRIKKKLKNTNGETITETLCALLIVVLAMTMLAGALVSAANVNKNTDLLDTVFTQTGNKQVTDGKVTIYHQTESAANKDAVSPSKKTVPKVNCYQTDDDNNYCYYTSK